MKITKRCSKCNETKQLSEFYKHPTHKDGHLNQCKSCHRAYNRQFSRTEHRRDYQKTYQKEYIQSEKNKVAQRCAVNKYQKRHPEHQKAKDAVKSAIRAGKLSRPDNKLCHYCPKPAQQYHHWSYLPEHQLDVIPVCRDCHQKCKRKIA